MNQYHSRERAFAVRNIGIQLQTFAASDRVLNVSAHFRRREARSYKSQNQGESKSIHLRHDAAFLRACRAGLVTLRTANVKR